MSGGVKFKLSESGGLEKVSTSLAVLWHVSIQGRLVQFYRSGVEMPHREKLRRDAIGPWSMQSRMRLQKLLNTVDSSKVNPAVFITLTYPDHVRRLEYKERSVDRAKFWRYVESYLGRNVPAFWRIEWEERKSGAYTGKLAPHFHLMAFGVPFLPWQDVREWWRKSIGAGDGPLSTEVKRIKGVDAVSRYVSKYVSKYRSLDISTYHNSGIKFGRHWGVLRPEMVPYAPVVLERLMTTKEIDRVQRYAQSKWSWYDKDLNGGYSLFGKKWADNLAKMFGCS